VNISVKRMNASNAFAQADQTQFVEAWHNRIKRIERLSNPKRDLHLLRHQN